MTCVGVPMGSPEFVTAFVRSKAKILQQDVQKLLSEIRIFEFALWH
jgi:hypothetical protein